MEDLTHQIPFSSSEESSSEHEPEELGTPRPDGVEDPLDPGDPAIRIIQSEAWAGRSQTFGTQEHEDDGSSGAESKKGVGCCLLYTSPSPRD